MRGVRSWIEAMGSTRLPKKWSVRSFWRAGGTICCRASRAGRIAARLSQRTSQACRCFSPRCSNTRSSNAATDASRTYLVEASLPSGKTTSLHEIAPGQPGAISSSDIGYYQARSPCLRRTCTLVASHQRRAGAAGYRPARRGRRQTGQACPVPERCLR